MAGEIAERQQLTPVRAISVLTEQIFANVLGGRAGVLRRTKLAQAELGQATAAANDYQSVTNKLGRAEFDRAKLTDKATGLVIAGNEDAYKAQTELIDGPGGLKDAQKNAQEYAEQAQAIALKGAKKIAGPRQVASSLLAGLAGITIGTTAFSAIMQGAQMATEASTKAIGAQIDMLSNWGVTATRVTTSLGQSTTQMQGNAKAAIAQAGETAGLNEASLTYIGTQLQLTAAVKAGATAEGQAGDLFRAAQGAGGGTPQGLQGGFGGLFGSSLLAQQLGGGAGFTELLAGSLLGTANARPGPDIGQNLNQGVQFVTNDAFRNYVLKQGNAQGGSGLNTEADLVGRAGDALGQTLANNQLTAPFAQLLGLNNPQPGKPGAGPAGAGDQFQTLQSTLNDTQLKSMTAQFGNFNDEVTRGAKRLGVSTRATIDYAKSEQDVTDATAAAVQANDAYSLSLAQTGIVFRDAAGNVIKTGDQLKAATEAAAVGAGIPTTASILQQQTQGIAAQRASILASGQIERKLTIPAGTALSDLASPLVPFSKSFSSAGASSQTSATLKGLTSDAKGLDAQIQQNTKDGIAAMKALVPPEEQAAFSVALANVTKLGKEIEQIQQDTIQRDLNLQIDQYNNDLRITSRSLTDALQITGQLGATNGDNLGLLEKQNIALGRQATTLSLMLQQRQITTQLALAGIQAPGQSGEERYVRRTEATAEAGIAQKQLNIQKTQFQVGIKIVDIGNARAVTDLVHQLALLQKGKQVSILDAADAATLTRLTKLIDPAVAKVQSFLGDGEKIISAAISAAEQVASITGDSFVSILKATEKAWGMFGNQAKVVLDAATGTAPATPGVVHGHNDTLGGTSGGTHAGGYLGTVGMATHMIVGEAGSETVAILRNPRTVTSAWGGGGGGGAAAPIIININHPTVRSDADLQNLANEVAREVTRALGKKALLLGLRGPAH